MYASMAMDRASCSVTALCACAPRERTGQTRRLKTKAVVLFMTYSPDGYQVREQSNGNGSIAAMQIRVTAGKPCPFWVKTGKAQCEHMISALPLGADIAQQTRHVRKVPLAEVSRSTQ